MPNLRVDENATAAEEPDRSKNVIAGVVAAAAGTEVLGLVADLAQVVTIDNVKDYLLVGNAFIVLFGMVALFGPGRTEYRRSAVRVGITGLAVMVSGTVAAVFVLGNLSAETPAAAGAAAPPSSGSPLSHPPSSIDPRSPTAQPPAAPTGPPSAGTGGGTPRTKGGPTRPPISKTATVPPTKKAPSLSATMSCRPSCTTSSDLIALGGSLTGSLPDDHQLMLFVEAPDGRHYPGSHGQIGSGTWSGKVHVGSPNGTEASYDYTSCVYDIDATFSSWLADQSEATLNQGLERVPAAGAAGKLACRALTWNRP